MRPITKEWIDKAEGDWAIDLVKLLKAVLPVEPSWTVLETDLIPLTDFAIEYRYPGITATKSEAKAAVAYCRKVRRAIRRAFELRG